jgi:hypothetical protein
VITTRMMPDWKKVKIYRHFQAQTEGALPRRRGQEGLCLRTPSFLATKSKGLVLLLKTDEKSALRGMR